MRVARFSSCHSSLGSTCPRCDIAPAGRHGHDGPYRISRRCSNLNEGNLMIPVCVKMWAASLLIGIAALAAMVPSRAQFATLPVGPNRELVEAVCGSCHDIEMVAINGRSEERWRLTIDEMAGYGMRVSPGDRELILRYLATYLPAK